MAAERWIAVDWGTSNLRAWLIEADREVAEATSDKGMNSLERADFEPALLESVGHWLSGRSATRVLACGMVGARQGWQEAPYRFLPCRPAASDAPMAVATEDPRLAVFILPGLAQESPGDVMRGEETQIAGFLAKHPGFEGSLCLPGTHSKWIAVEDGEVVSFRTFMTGELYSLLARQSVLRHSMAGEGEDGPAFLAAVDAALRHPEDLAGRLFPLRAESLLHGLAPATARARLSGLLIGAELAAARPYWKDRSLGLIAPASLTVPYRQALEAQGAGSRSESAEEMVLGGLKAAAAAMGDGLSG